MNNLKEFTNGELIEELQRRGYIRVLWHKEDVEVTATQMGITLTEDQVADVVTHIEDYFDANIGVNWDVIQYHVGYVNSPEK